MDQLYLYDDYIRNSISKKFGQRSFEHIDDAISEAHIWYLENINHENIKKGMLLAAYKTIGKMMCIEYKERNLMEDENYMIDPKIDHKTANINLLPYGDQFFNSLTDIERLIVECKTDYDYKLLPQIISGRSSKYLNTAYFIILKKYEPWVKAYINNLEKYNKRIQQLNDTKVKEVALLLIDGHRTSSIARIIHKSLNNTAQLVYVARRFLSGESFVSIRSTTIPKRSARRIRSNKSLVTTY